MPEPEPLNGSNNPNGVFFLSITSRLVARFRIALKSFDSGRAIKWE